MAVKLPYMVSPGLIPKILAKIQEARRPERFTQDFLETKLGHSGGSARAIIPLLKRLGFLSSDGAPTERYDRFRNEETQDVAVAEGLRTAYAELFDRNEYVSDLPRDKLSALIAETTGAAKDDRPAQLTVATFWTLKKMADFEGETSAPEKPEPSPSIPTATQLPHKELWRPTAPADSYDFKVAYTINLILPETTNPEVFNAIFRSLKENLLKD